MRLAIFLLPALAFGQSFEVMPLATVAQVQPATITLPAACDATCRAALAQVLAQLTSPAAAPTPAVVPAVSGPPSSAAGVSSSRAFTAPAAAPASDAVPVCPTIFGLATAYSPASSPKMTASAFVATLFPGVTCSGGLQAYSYTQYIESPIKVHGTWTLSQNVTTGLAVPMRSIGPFEVWAIGTVGPSVQGSTSTVSLGTTYGGMITLPKGNWLFMAAYQRINNSNEILAGAGYEKR